MWGIGERKRGAPRGLGGRPAPSSFWGRLITIPPCGRGPYGSTNSRPARAVLRVVPPSLRGALSPPPFPFDHPAQSLTARRAAKSLARAATGEREIDFAPRTVAPRKIGTCRWALALARRYHTLARRIGRRGEARLSGRCPQAFGATRPVLPALSLAFFPTVAGLPILSAGTPASPATSGGAALRATVSGLGMGGTKILLASLE